jgi:hypothetical protein
LTQLWRGSPQIQQLQTIAAQTNVELTVFSIGGNTLNFLGIKDCVTSDVFGGEPCAAGDQATMDANMGTAMAAVGASMPASRPQCSRRAYSPSSYRLILQGYPSP